MTSQHALIRATQKLSRQIKELSFAPPTAYVYNPLDYAREPYGIYLERYGAAPKKVVFLGMNPGPWGMAQTGVPFGEIDTVKNWLGIDCLVEKPSPEHPKRPITGFACTRSEVSGRRLWGLFSQLYATADVFFKDHYVANYCPLVFMEESGRNRTPDKLPVLEKQALFSKCDEHLRQVMSILQPTWVIGVGKFAEDRARSALEGTGIQIGRILHPSPASPAANKDWAGTALTQMQELSIW